MDPLIILILVSKKFVPSRILSSVVNCISGVMLFALSMSSFCVFGDVSSNPQITSSMKRLQNLLSGDLDRMVFSIVYMKILAYAGAILVPIAVPSVCP